jgi:hypothetical protein
MFGHCSTSVAIYKISLSVIFYIPYCCTLQHIFKFAVQCYQHILLIAKFVVDVFGYVKTSL